jgi:hypothetical protein
MLNYISLFLNSCYLFLCVLWFVNFKTFSFPSFHLPIYSPTNLNLSTHLPTHLPTHPPIYQPIYLPTHFFTYLPTHLATHLPTYLHTIFQPSQPTLWNVYTKPFEKSIPFHHLVEHKNDPPHLSFQLN